LTPSNTPTNTRTFTSSPTFTNSFTPTNTRTFTNTHTPTNTPTFTKTPTVTNTSTLTPTATFTRTFTSTFTSTNTRTFTNTYTSTHTPTFTHTFTSTRTPTDTRTFTVTFTATNTSTVTFTPTITNTPAPDIEISKTSPQTSAMTGVTLTYNLKLTVSGAAAQNVQVTDVLPSHLMNISVDAVPMGGTETTSLSTLTWNWASLPQGVYVLTYHGVVDNQVKVGDVLKNNAQVTYTGQSSPKTTSVSIPLAELFTVKVGVYNETGELVKQLSVTELSSAVNALQTQNPVITSLQDVIGVVVDGQQLTAWDGTTQNGTPASNGKYTLQVSSTDPFGVTTSVDEQVTVSRNVAKIQVNIYNEAGEIIKHLYGYVDDPKNVSLSNFQISSAFIQPTSGTPVPGGNNTLTITGANGVSIVWDGTSDSGAMATSGHYVVEVVMANGAGSQTVISQGIVVQAGHNSGANGLVQVGPNILTGGATGTTVSINSPLSLTLTVRMYDVAGELIRTTQGVAGSNQASLDASGLASGLYLVVTDLTDANGHFIQKQISKLLIQK